MTKPVLKRRPVPAAAAAPAPAPAAPSLASPSLATDDRMTVTVKEAVRLTGSNKSMIYALLADGRLSDVKIGRTRGRYIRLDELRAIFMPAPAATQAPAQREAA
jgi:excisionase family DNA binding protein